MMIKTSVVLVLGLLVAMGPVHGSLTVQPPVAPASLNHAYVVVDSITYDAIRKSDFVRKEFAHFEERTTVRPDRSYTGVYLYGTHTYFEVFDVATHSSRQLGYSAVAYGVDQAGAIKALVETTDKRITLAAGNVAREDQARQVPWFYSARPDGFASAGLSTWLMEYHPRFLTEWRPSLTPDREGVTRRQVLARYVAALGEVPNTRYFQDIVGMTIAADEPTVDRMLEFSRDLGHQVQVSDRDVVVTAPDFQLRFIAVSAERTGIQQVTMRTKGEPPASRSEIQFGERSVLKFIGNGLATWSF